MNSKLEKLFEQAKALSDEERDWLIRMLELHDRCGFSPAEVRVPLLPRYSVSD